MKNKQELMKLAVRLLKETNLLEVETVDVDSTDYDDGSSTLEISISYPTKQQTPFEYLTQILSVGEERITYEVSFGAPEKEELEYDQDEAVTFIQRELTGKYNPQRRELIKDILDAEEDYMRSKGIIED